MSRLFLILLAMAAGTLDAVQAGASAQLTKGLGQPWWAAIVGTLITLVVLAVATAVTGQPLPSPRAVAAVPWWAWLGGICGAFFVLSMLLCTGPLGAGLYIGLTVSCALVASVVVDHFGWIGLDVHPAGIGRITGAVFMLLGVALIAAF